MTIGYIQTILKNAGLPCSKAQVYRDLSELGIEQTTRQRPARYPDNAATRILRHRGIKKTGEQVMAEAITAARAHFSPLDTAAARVAALPALSELKRTAKKARDAR